MARLIILFMISVVSVLSSPWALSLTNADVAVLPAIFKQDLVRPKVVVAVDTSESMLTRAYEDDSFDSATTYDGYFNNKFCYRYQKNLGEGRGGFRTDGKKDGACPEWSGNYLNWLTMRRIDIARNVLTGGTVKAFRDGKELTRRQMASAGYTTATYYIVEGEKITATNTAYFTEDDDRNLNGAVDDTPYQYAHRLHICHGRIIVTKDNNDKDASDLRPYCGVSNIDAVDDNNNPSNNSQIDQYEIRIRKWNAPEGLIQAKFNEYDFGVSVYQFNHSSSPDYTRQDSVCGEFRDNNLCHFGSTIYRFNAYDGGTLRPCYPDITKPVTQRTNYDICTETYAGAPLEDLVDVIEYYPLSAGQTAIAETLYEIGGYVKQTNHGKRSSGPQFYDTGSTVGAYKIASSTERHWDPYYNKKTDTLVDCTKIFVININDGVPFNDFQPTGVSYLAGDGHPNLPGLWRNGNTESVDSVVWSLRGDCRSDLPGQQEVKPFFVYADLSGNIDNSQLRPIREAAAVGIADIDYDPATGAKTFIDDYFLNVSNPFNNTNAQSKFDQIIATAGESWDKDGDGNPDNFLLAQSSQQLQSALVSVLKAITREVAASSNASVVTQNSAGEGAIYQALMFPYLTDVNNPSKTLQWSGNVWGLFLDDKGFYREDGNGNGKLDESYTLDPAIQYVERDDGSAYFLRKSVTENADGDYIMQTLPGEVATPLYFLRPIWDALSWLNKVTDTSAVTQRTYTDTTTVEPKRYIITGTKDLARNGSGATVRQQNFLPDTLADKDNAEWFGLDCDDMSDADCNQEITDIIEYIRGRDDISGLRSRTIDLGQGAQRMLMGDISNSSPVVVAEPSENYDLLGDESYAAFKAHYKNRRQMVYVGANDGMLHAFNGGFKDPRGADILTSVDGQRAYELGMEMWAYVPVNTWPQLQFLKDPEYVHTFYVDGSPQAFDVKIFPDSTDHPGGWGTILVITMGYGGVKYTVDDNGDDVKLRSSMIILDITNPEKPPTVLDEYSRDTSGHMISSPILTVDREPSGGDWSSASNQWYLNVGSGPQHQNDGNSNINPRVFVYNLNTLSHVTGRYISGWKGFIGGLAAVDWVRVKGKGFKTDEVFVTTVENSIGNRGVVYRMRPDGSAKRTLFEASHPISTAARPFYGLNQRWLYFGSGKLTASLDNTTSQQQRFWGIKVPEAFGDKAEPAKIVDTTQIQVNQNGNLACGGSCPGGSSTVTHADLQRHMTSADVHGWRFDLLNGDNNVAGGEPSGRLLGRPNMSNQIVFFTSYTPTPELCEEGGVSHIYGVDFLTGTSPNFSIFGSEASDSSPFNRGTELGPGAAREVVINTSGKSSDGILDLHTVNSRAELQRTEASVGGVGNGRVSWREMFVE